jgi:predicted Rdx family selenoprotein
VAAQLKQDLGVEAALVVGGAGELTIWVDDDKVMEKHQGRFPEPGAVVDAVRARRS